MNTNAIKDLITIDEILVPAMLKLNKLEESVATLKTEVQALETKRHTKLQELRSGVYAEDYPVTYKYGDNVYIFTWANGGPQFNLVKKTLVIS